MVAVIRMQVQLTEAQASALRRLASERGHSVARIVREAVDRLLAEGDERDRVWERALAAVGRYPDREGARDVSEEHDRYLDEAYLDWRR